MATEDRNMPLTMAYAGWDNYQRLMAAAIAPLTAEQLALRAAPQLRSIGELAAHIIAVRFRWFHMVFGVSGDELAPLGTWDRVATTHRTAELVEGLEATWRMIEEALESWRTADLTEIMRGTHRGEPYELSRQWVIWHVIEHDLHHGGELSFSLGMHGLTGLDI